VVTSTPAQPAPAVVETPQVRRHAVVTQVGSGKPIRISAKGTGLPLRIAVPVVLPKGWKTNFDPAVSDRRVSFDASKKPWTEVLNEMARKTGADMVVNWRNGTVQVGTMASAAGDERNEVQPIKGGIVKKAVIGKPGTAREIANRYRKNVDDFCRWNHFGPGAWLASGYEVYLEEPPAGTPVFANITAAPHDKYGDNPPSQALHQPQVAAKDPVTEPAVKAEPAPLYEAPKPSAEIHPVEVSVPVSHQYEIGPGSLSTQLLKWCEAAGYSLVWKVKDDYSITTHAGFGSDFHAAVTGLFHGMMDSGFPLRVTIYEMNKFVEVTEE